MKNGKIAPGTILESGGWKITFYPDGFTVATEYDTYHFCKYSTGWVTVEDTIGNARAIDAKHDDYDTVFVDGRKENEESEDDILDRT